MPHVKRRTGEQNNGRVDGPKNNSSVLYDLSECCVVCFRPTSSVLWTHHTKHLFFSALCLCTTRHTRRGHVHDRVSTAEQDVVLLSVASYRKIHGTYPVTDSYICKRVKRGQDTVHKARHIYVLGPSHLGSSRVTTTRAANTPYKSVSDHLRCFLSASERSAGKKRKKRSVPTKTSATSGSAQKPSERKQWAPARTTTGRKNKNGLKRCATDFAAGVQVVCDPARQLKHRFYVFCAQKASEGQKNTKSRAGSTAPPVCRAGRAQQEDSAQRQKKRCIEQRGKE